MMARRRRRDPYWRSVVRLPERDLAESILHLAAPLLDALGPTPGDQARRAIELAISIWNAHVTASQLWLKPARFTGVVAALRGALSAKNGLKFGAASLRL